MTTSEILASNLLEAYRQINQFTIFSIGASGSALAIGLYGAPKASQEVPGISIPLPREVAMVVLLILTIFGGVFAQFSAENAVTISDQLQGDQDLVNAIRTFPTFVTSPYLLPKYLPMITPVGFAFGSLLCIRKVLNVQSWVVWLVFLGAAFLPALSTISRL